MSTESEQHLPVVVIGAGPVGLAAAAHLHLRGIDVQVLEAGSSAGANIMEWGHVRLFTPWRDTIDDAGRLLLEQEGWSSPPLDALPTGDDFVSRYLRPLAEVAALRPRIRYDARAIAVSRRGHDKIRSSRRDEVPYEVVTESPAGPHRLRAAAVVDASGTYRRPNPLGANGLPAKGEIELRGAISYGIPDVLGNPREFGGRRVLVVGSGHSAQNVVIDLFALQDAYPETQITWAVRSETAERLLGGGASDPIPQRAQLGLAAEEILNSGRVRLELGAEIDALAPRDGAVEVFAGDRVIAVVDRVVASTGFRPDGELLAEVRLDLDPILECPVKLAPLIDPRVHWCGSVPEHGAEELAHPDPGLFVVGMKSYGRAPTFLLTTGYAQVRSVAAWLADAAGLPAAEDAGSLDLAAQLRAGPPGDRATVCCGGSAARPPRCG